MGRKRSDVFIFTNIAKKRLTDTIVSQPLRVFVCFGFYFVRFIVSIAIMSSSLVGIIATLIAESGAEM